MRAGRQGFTSSHVGGRHLGSPERSSAHSVTRDLLLNLARSRLAAWNATPRHQFPTSETRSLSGISVTLGAELGKKRLFSERFVQKLEEFGGDTRAWVSWAREERNSPKIAAVEQERRQRELSRQASDKSGRPKWIMKVRLQTPSHSLRQKALNFWNDRIDVVKLYHVGNKKNELLLEMTIYDNVALDQLFDAGMSLSKMYITMLSIGTAGFFWYELSGQAQTYYESIRDLDAPHLEPRIRRVIGLAGQWAEDGPERSKRRRVALEEAHLNVAYDVSCCLLTHTGCRGSAHFRRVSKGSDAARQETICTCLSRRRPATAFLKTLRRAMRRLLRVSHLTSANVGKEDAAPRRVTLMAAALLAKFMASGTEADFARAAAKPPIKQSPAPVVSTAFTL